MQNTPDITQRVVPAATRANHPQIFAASRVGNTFANPWPHSPLPSLGEVLRWKTQSNTQRSADYRVRPVPLAPSPMAGFDALRSHATRVLWIGHASFLVDMDETRLVIDPIFGPAAVVTRRVTPASVTPQQLGPVDAVLVTHGHHDHMDGASLRAIARERAGKVVFVVQEGLARWLPSECRPFVELPWWSGVRIGQVTVWSVPAQHWHQRGLTDRNRAGWGGYVIEGSQRVYHSGDTGHFAGFRAIGEVFGGVDAACLPLGAYEPSWFMGTQHMSPEGSLSAFDELRAGTFVGMHWGAFDLSDEPVEAGPAVLAELVRTQRREAERFAVLKPGGAVGLSGPSGNTSAEILHRYGA